MLKDITLGQYFPGNSLAHRLDPRTKLILTVLYIVILFCAKGFVSYGVVALLLLTGGLGGEQPASRLSLALLTAAVMALGTALGGKPIVEKMGTELANLTPAEGLSADLGAGVVLLVCSALGLPVSTTHAKVSAICGAGRGADRRVMGQMAGAWALTFPVCGGVAFALTRLMMG